MSKISANDVVPEGQVEGVHPETRTERFIRIVTDSVRMFTASIIAIAGFVVLVCVIWSANPEYVKYHDGAWSLILTMIGAALGFMFASKG